MRQLFLAAFLLVWPAAAQYSVEPAGPCKAEGVSAALAGSLEADGYRVKDGSGAAFVEVWLRKDIPSHKGDGRGSDFPNLVPASALGVIRYARAGGDFRGQPIQTGVYVMRFNLQPEDGDHQGASPRRDHILLSPVGADQDPGTAKDFDAAVELSRKASGTRHPSVLFLAAPEPGTMFPSVGQHGPRITLNIKGGALGLGIIIAGKAEE